MGKWLYNDITIGLVVYEIYNFGIINNTFKNYSKFAQKLPDLYQKFILAFSLFLNSSS